MDKKLAAVIVETRDLPYLRCIIEEHIDKLPDYTDLIIYHSTANEFLKLLFPKAIFRLIENEILNEQAYNIMLTTASFWDGLIDYDKVLIFQHDSMILRKGIEEFYHLDYVGAAWKFQPYMGGNGGLSLRNPKIMKLICLQNNYRIALGNEDLFFVNIMINNEIGILASIEDCDRFSVETKFTLGSFGYHAIEKHLTEQEVIKIKNQYNC